MNMTAPFYSKENWGSESLRKCPVPPAHRGKPSVRVKSRSVLPQNLRPFHIPVPTPTPGIFCLLCVRLSFLPIRLHKAPRTPSFALQPTNVFSALGEWCLSKRSTCHLNIYTDNPLTCQVPGCKMLRVTQEVGTRTSPKPGSPRVLPGQQFLPVGFCRNQFRFYFERVFTAIGNKHLKIPTKPPAQTCLNSARNTM